MLVTFAFETRVAEAHSSCVRGNVEAKPIWSHLSLEVQTTYRVSGGNFNGLGEEGADRSGRKLLKDY